MSNIKERKVRTACFAAAILLQLTATLSLLTYTARTKHYAQKNGRIVNLACRAYDPYNPFKGRYVRLSFEEANVDKSKLDAESFENQSKRGDIYYLRMEEGADSLWTVRGIRAALPKQDGNIYIQGQTYIHSLDTVHITFPCSEYYMQENYAQYVDTIQWQDFNALQPVLSLYVDKKGRCIQKGLSVLDGTVRISIEEYCKRHIRT